MAPDLHETEFELFKNLIKKRTGITLKHSKRQSFGRKLAARLEVLGITSFTGYYRLVKSEKGADELRELINLITIGQTSFFRGDRQFALLSSHVLPDIVKKNRRLKRMRIWSAGCSKGHEPYSLAMLIQDEAKGALTWDIRILATDIDSDSLKKAYRGRYNKEEISLVPEEYAKKFLSRDRKSEASAYVVKDRIRKNLVFRRLNLLEFPYPLTGPVDMILCRNVMIYFSTAVKKQIMTEFLRLLPDGGYLCLGASKSLLGIDDRFSLIGHAVYQKKPFTR